MSTAQRIDGLSYEEYDAIDAVRATHLKCSTELEYLDAVLQPRPETDALLRGRASHTAYLEPQQFLREYVLQPEDIKRRTGKAWDAFAAANASKTILTERQYQEALDIAKAIESRPETSGRRVGAATEVTLVWVDQRTGLRCKARLDLLHEDGPHPVIDDLKTTGAPRPERWGRDAERYGYHLQMAFYGYGYNTLFGAWPECNFIVAQSARPHDAWLVACDDDAIELGCDLMHERLAMVASAQRKRAAGAPAHGHASG